MPEPAFQERIMQDEIGNVGHLVHLGGQRIVGGQHAVQFERLQLRPHGGQKPRAGELVPPPAHFGGEIAGGVNRDHQEDEVNRTIEQSDAQAQARINPLPAVEDRISHFVFEINGDFSMHRVAKKLEDE